MADVRVTISTVPSSGSSAIDRIEYRLDQDDATIATAPLTAPGVFNIVVVPDAEDRDIEIGQWNQTQFSGWSPVKSTAAPIISTIGINDDLDLLPISTNKQASGTFVYGTTARGALRSPDGAGDFNDTMISKGTAAVTAFPQEIDLTLASAGGTELTAWCYQYITIDKPSNVISQDFVVNTVGGASITDDFNRADEAISANANWSSVGVNDNRIVSNEARSAATAQDKDYNKYVGATTLTANRTVGFTTPTRLTTPATNRYFMLFLGITDTNNYIAVRIKNSGTLELRSNVAGTRNTVGNFTVTTPADGMVYSAVRTGSNIELFVDGVSKGTVVYGDQLTAPVGFGFYDVIDGVGSIDDFTAVDS